MQFFLFSLLLSLTTFIHRVSSLYIDPIEYFLIYSNFFFVVLLFNLFSNSAQYNALENKKSVYNNKINGGSWVALFEEV